MGNKYTANSLHCKGQDQVGHIRRGETQQFWHALKPQELKPAAEPGPGARSPSGESHEATP